MCKQLKKSQNSTPCVSFNSGSLVNVLGCGCAQPFVSTLYLFSVLAQVQPGTVQTKIACSYCHSEVMVDIHCLYMSMQASLKQI